jgi:hypothetical protein
MDYIDWERYAERASVPLLALGNGFNRRIPNVVPKLMLSLPLITSACLTAMAQKEYPHVDWEAKALATELHRLGDPDIDLILPDLYQAMARSPDELAKSSDGQNTYRKASQQSTMMDLLRDPKVRHELEMLDEQYEQLEAKVQDVQRRTNGRALELLAEAKNGSLPQQKVRDSILALRQQAVEEIEKSILPFQFRRLRQIAYHVQMGHRGVAEVLTTDPIASELKLTDEQKARLRETADEVEKELAEEIAKLRAKAKVRLYAELNKEQQNRLSQLLGDDFDGTAVGVNPKRDGTEQRKKSSDKEGK